MQYIFLIAITLLSLVGCKNSQNNNTLLNAESTECKELALRQPGFYDAVCGGKTAQENDESRTHDSADTQGADVHNDSAAKDGNAEAATGTPTLFDNMFRDSTPDNAPNNNYENINNDTAIDPVTEAGPVDIFGGPGETEN